MIITMTSDRIEIAKKILQRRTVEGGRYPSLEDTVNRISGSDKLLFYAGYDPTNDNLHIGNTVSLLLLKSLSRDLGHSVIILFGDFTARIGDPTGKESVRRVLSEDEIAEHMATWDKQIAKLFGDVPYTIKHNNEWLSIMSFADVIKLSAKVTVQQMMARDMFQERLKKERPIYLNEFLYPLAQGYDSVAMRVDGEVGGSDQIFNMLVGRELSKDLIGKDKLVLATPLLIDASSGKKMSKSEGSLIALTDEPQTIREKVLNSIPDDMVRTVFELCTEKEQEWIDQNCPKDGKLTDPREIKEKLSDELIRIYYGEDSIEPSRAPIEVENGILITGGSMPIVLALKGFGIANSMSESKTLIKQGAVKVNDKIIDNWDYQIKSGDIIKVGKGKLFKVK